jgi:hypothetical protein
MRQVRCLPSACGFAQPPGLATGILGELHPRTFTVSFRAAQSVCGPLLLLGSGVPVVNLTGNSYRFPARLATIFCASASTRSRNPLLVPW